MNTAAAVTEYAALNNRANRGFFFFSTGGKDG
jgi:hypothetical protein